MTVDIVTATVHGITITGNVFVHATAVSTVDFQAAQGTDAGTTTIERGSWLMFEPIPIK
jgi:hypothetical protein